MTSLRKWATEQLLAQACALGDRGASAALPILRCRVGSHAASGPRESGGTRRSPARSLFSTPPQKVPLGGTPRQSPDEYYIGDARHGARAHLGPVRSVASREAGVSTWNGEQHQVVANSELLKAPNDLKSPCDRRSPRSVLRAWSRRRSGQERIAREGEIDRRHGLRHVYSTVV